jgi:hypothetical protein
VSPSGVDFVHFNNIFKILIILNYNIKMVEQLQTT